MRSATWARMMRRASITPTMAMRWRKRWRMVTLPMALGWVFFAGWAAWVEFYPQSWAHWGLVITSLYLTFAGIAQQIIPDRSVQRVS